MAVFGEHGGLLGGGHDGFPDSPEYLLLRRALLPRTQPLPNLHLHREPRHHAHERPRRRQQLVGIIVFLSPSLPPVQDRGERGATSGFGVGTRGVLRVGTEAPRSER